MKLQTRKTSSVYAKERKLIAVEDGSFPCNSQKESQGSPSRGSCQN